MPTILGVLLTTVAVYFCLEKRVVLSAVFAGLSLLAKEQSMFILPVLIFIIFFYNTEKKVLLLRKVLLFLLITVMIASPQYINNFIVFGDPVFPHGYFLFKSPYQAEAMELTDFGRSTLNVSNLLNPEYSVVQPYVEFFGVPHIKSASSLSILNIPFLGFLLLLWFVASLVFTLPLVYGFLKIKKDLRFSVLLMWFCSFFFLLAQQRFRGASPKNIFCSYSLATGQIFVY